MVERRKHEKNKKKMKKLKSDNKEMSAFLYIKV
jgi:hypothetical protein